MVDTQNKLLVSHTVHQLKLCVPEVQASIEACVLSKSRRANGFAMSLWGNLGTMKYFQGKVGGWAKLFGVSNQQIFWSSKRKVLRNDRHNEDEPVM